MQRLPLFLVPLLALAACTDPDQGAADPAAARPNILWLVAEDMSQNIAPFGDSTVVTPHLERLAREGIRFPNTFSVSGVCAPSRFSIATGIYTTSGKAQHMRTTSSQDYHDIIGVPPYEAVPPPEVRMMSEILRMHGYFATNNAKRDYQFSPPVTAWDESSNQAHWRQRPDGAPFFSIFNFGVTHESRIWAKADDSLHVPADLDAPIPPYLPGTEAVRTDVRRMYSNIRELDHRIGNLLAELEADGLLDETIIFFYSDHGGPLPRQKRQLYDSGLRVPLIVRLPDGTGAGSVDERLVSFVDLAPTVFSLAGVPLPGYLEGQAFLGGAQAQEPRAYIHAAADRFDSIYDTKRAVRDGRFKYLRNLRPERGYYLAVTYREQMATMQELLRLRDSGGLNEAQAQWFRDSKPEEELFDTWSDPHELRSIAAEPAHAEKLAELRDELDRWMAATGDAGTMPEPELVESIWPGGVQPKTAAPTATMEGGLLRLGSTTQGASIGYRFPDEERWRVYAGPVALGTSSHVEAVSHRIGFAPSSEVTLPR